jgi:hypothetical protein
MKPSVALAFASLAGGCGTQEDAVPVGNHAFEDGARPMQKRPGGRPEVPADCPLVIEFGSYAMGIDPGAARAVRELLASDPGIQSVERYPWGREGESTTCVYTRSTADAERLFHAIARLFPTDPRGPLSVATRTGLRHGAGRP